MEVDVGELFGDEVEQPGLGELVDLRVKTRSSRKCRARPGENACM